MLCPDGSTGSQPCAPSDALVVSGSTATGYGAAHPGTAEPWPRDHDLYDVMSFAVRGALVAAVLRDSDQAGRQSGDPSTGDQSSVALQSSDKVPAGIQHRFPCRRPAGCRRRGTTTQF